MKQRTRPCDTCPFARTTAPKTLGGSSPETFVGQANGKFIIPCHCHIDYSDPDWRLNSVTNASQCAGAAIFRANLVIQQDGGLVKLPKDTETVFASFAEFHAHHREITVAESAVFLKTMTPEILTLHEMERAGVRFHLIPKQ